jgi:hypothetical protein
MIKAERETIKMAAFGGSEFNTEDGQVIVELAKAIVDVATYANVELYIGMSKGYVHQLVLVCVELRQSSIDEHTLCEGQLRIVGYSPWDAVGDHQKSQDPQDLLDLVDEVNYLKTEDYTSIEDRFYQNGQRLANSADMALVMVGGGGTKDELRHAINLGMTIAVYTAVGGTEDMVTEFDELITEKNCVVRDDNAHSLLWQAVEHVLSSQQTDNYIGDGHTPPSNIEVYS